MALGLFSLNLHFYIKYSPSGVLPSSQYRASAGSDGLIVLY